MNFASRLLARIAVFNELLCNSAKNFAGILLMTMTAIVLLQIVCRYVLNDSLIWTEEVAKTMMVWSAFLVAPLSYRTSANVSIDMFVDQLSQRTRAILHLLLNFLVIWIIVVFLIESVGFFQRGINIRAASLPIQMAWFYSIVPLSFAALFIVGVELVLRDVLSLFYPGEQFLIPHSETVEGE